MARSEVRDGLTLSTVEAMAGFLITRVTGPDLHLMSVEDRLKSKAETDSDGFMQSITLMEKASLLPRPPFTVI